MNRFQKTRSVLALLNFGFSEKTHEFLVKKKTPAFLFPTDFADGAENFEKLICVISEICGRQKNSKSSRMPGDKILTPSLYLVAHGAEFCPDFFFRTFRLGWVGEVLVQTFAATGKVRAAFVGVVAHGDDEVGRIAHVLVDIVARVVGDIDAVFHHGRDGARIETMRFHASAVNAGAVAGELFEVAMRHLAAATIAGAEDEDVFHRCLINNNFRRV